jgi:hypothetical protein
MKETFYFPHDSNAIQDPKMIMLLNKCGLFGVGAFWVVIEILHQQRCGGIGVAELQSCLSFYGKQGSWDEALIGVTEKALFETKLLVLKDGIVYSERVINNLKKRDELSKSGRENAMKRWGNDANPMRTHRLPYAIKERKGKESIIGDVATKQSLKRPTPEELKAYCKEIAFSLDSAYFLDYQEARGWRLKGGQAIKDWKAVVRTWKRNNLSNPGREKSEVIG